MTMFCGFSQTDSKSRVVGILDDKFSWKEMQQVKGCVGSRGQGCCLEEVKCHYWGSGGGEGEELTLSKLANRLGSHGAWWGEEGAKGSGTESLAGREENSPEP